MIIGPDIRVHSQERQTFVFIGHTILFRGLVSGKPLNYWSSA